MVKGNLQTPGGGSEKILESGIVLALISALLAPFQPFYTDTAPSVLPIPL
jgi:hypothetical protein